MKAELNLRGLTWSSGVCMEINNMGDYEKMMALIMRDMEMLKKEIGKGVKQ